MPTPTKFTPEVRATILEAIRNGCYRFQACGFAGVSRQTLYEWEQEAKENPDSEKAAFIEEMSQAQDYAEAKLMILHNALATGAELPEDLSKMMNAEGNDWRKREFGIAIRHQLERGGTRPWADVRQVEVTGKDGGPLEVAAAASERVSDALEKIAKRAEEEAAALAAAAAAAEGTADDTTPEQPE